MTKSKLVAAIMTCHNRKEKTVRCIDSLLTGNLSSIDIYLVDDGSTDGTSEAVKTSFPQTHIIQGSGNLFWNKGMHLAFSSAVGVGYHFYLWVNDDVIFDPGAVDKLVAAYQELSIKQLDTIVVGPTLDKSRTINTYGGFGAKKSIKPYESQRIYLSEEYQECLIFHGNCVLIPQAVVDKIGVNDPFYSHAYGDIDYSLMAAKAGCKCWLANFAVGICERHDDGFDFLKPELPIRVRLENLHSRINHPYRDEFHFTRKFFGVWWPYKFMSADIRIIVSSLKYKLKALFRRK